MSKWRPSNDGCLYVIPDIHGMSFQLDVILKRILPLRNSGGVQDKIVLLGDYIDRRASSHLVIDTLIELEKEYPKQVIFIKGNHEDILLKAPSSDHNYAMWINNGGIETLYGYLLRSKKITETESFNISSFTRIHAHSYIPKEHLDFMRRAKPYHKESSFIFVHAGCDPFDSLVNQELNVLIWDRSLYRSISKIKGDLPWDECIITGHNGQLDGKLLIRDKFMMLDRSALDELVVVELNSMEAMVAKPDNGKLVKFDIAEFYE